MELLHLQHPSPAISALVLWFSRLETQRESVPLALALSSFNDTTGFSGSPVCRQRIIGLLIFHNCKAICVCVCVYTFTNLFSPLLSLNVGVCQDSEGPLLHLHLFPWQVHLASYFKYYLRQLSNLYFLSPRSLP